MKFLDILDLIPSDFMPTKDDYISMYKKALGYLNKMKCSRYTAMYFGSMSAGPDYYTWKDLNEFTRKYQACSIYIMNDLYPKMKANKDELIDISMSILYSMLACYVGALDYEDKEMIKLLDENDKYNINPDVEKEFSRKDEE